MAKKSSKSDVERATAPTVSTPPQRDFPGRIQPALKLSELISEVEASALDKANEAMRAINAQQAAIKQLSELNKTKEVMRAISAQQAAIKQLSELSKTSEAMKAIAAQQAAIKQLPELNKTSEAMKAAAAQQTALKRRLSELIKSSEGLKAISAHQKVAEQVRASLQLPQLEAVTKQATEAAAAVSRSLAGLTSARDIARGAASTIPAPVERRSASPSLSVGRANDSASAIPIASAHDLGQLVREARERRKLSQQAFADLAGVGRRFISELENGKATLEFDKVLQVASACGIDVQARPRR
jgi:HTH-type transcriptional regulator / antitoxin HipB